MKTKKHLRKKRIVIYYVLVIVIPSCILGFLALRGVRNDQALIEREQRKKLAEYGTSVFSETISHIAKINNSLEEKIPDLTPKFPSSLTFEEQTLNSLVEENKLIRSLFFIRYSDSIRIFHPSLIYFPELVEETEKERSPYNFINLFIPGWNYEYQEKDLQKALLYYRKRVKEFDQKEIKAYILMQIARIQTKQNTNVEALETYQLIESEYGNLTIDNQIHLGSMARLEKINISLLTGDTISALNYSIEFLNKILNAEWQLDYSSYKNLITSGNEILTRLKESGNAQIKVQLVRADSLFEEINIRDNDTKYLFDFLNNSSPFLMNYLNDSDSKIQFPVTKYFVSNENEFYISLFRGAKNQFWGIIFNVDEIYNELLLKSIRKHSENDNFSVAVIWKRSGVNCEFIRH